MGQFIKYTFASCLGVFLAFVLISLVFIGMMGVLISAGGQSTVNVKKESVLKVELKGNIPERTNNVSETGLSFERVDVLGLHEIMGLIEHAAQDEKIEGIYLVPTETYLGLASSSEFVEALRDFKESGKFIVSYAPYYSQGPYYLASVADAIILNPIGSVDFRGFASMVPFFKDLLDKTGVRMQVYYAGDFKSATEPFRRNDMSDENKVQLRAVLEDVYSEYLSEIAANRGVPGQELFNIANELKSSDSDAALDLRLVDEVGHEYAALHWMNKRMGKEPSEEIKFISIYDYYLSKPMPAKVSDNRIAVVYAEGEIVSGENLYGVITDTRYERVFDELRKNDNITTTVLRINSPGGSILASDNILKAIQLYKEEGKNLVVSMGDYAASGGYYIACEADKIFAEPSTITGSIGVYAMYPNVSELFNEKLGIHFDTVTTTNYAASFTPFLDWSAAEDKYLQARTDAYYQLFLQKVSEGRNMPVEQVHKIAQGRIWSGVDALDHELIDALGGLDQAIQSAADIAGYEDYKIIEYPKTLNPLNKLIAELSGQDIREQTYVFVEQLDAIIPGLKESYYLLRWKDPVARLPYQFDFH